MLDIIHHTSQQLQEMLPCRTAEKKPPHEVFAATIDCLQIGKTLLRNLEAVEANIRRSNTPEVRRIKIVNLGLVEVSKEGHSLAHGIWNCVRVAVHLKLRKCSKNRTWKKIWNAV